MSMISYNEAIAIILEQGKASLLDAETISLSAISGRICAEDIHAPIANQPFDNSAMDGFALMAGELDGAAHDNPVVLVMAGHLAAGDGTVVSAPLRGQCYEIMTGAPLPPGCDAVVPVERTERDKNGRVLFRAPARMGENIRRAASDFAIGDKVLESGAVMQSGHVLSLATLGIGAVQVVRKPTISLISTGLEVVDNLEASLGSGQIYNSTGPYLTAISSELGLEQVAGVSVGDDAALYKASLLEAAKSGCDLVLSTGAVSAGVHDFVPTVLQEMGAKIFFHKLAIRPGKPLLFAKLPNGGPFIFGLPGNPVSTAVGLRFFVLPLLRAMRGLPIEEPKYAMLAEDYKQNKAGLRLFLRGMLICGEDGVNRVSIIPKQQSFMVSPFVKSDVWVMIPENSARVECGKCVSIYQ